ncbi:MAG: hypothetical protein JWO03_3770 [Bacteroidetes bacterium]|nr:hypothetical protein [Bacteroidota bacterium]
MLAVNPQRVQNPLRVITGSGELKILYIASMNTTDWIGFIGVALLLVAFFLNLIKRISPDSLPYMLLNLSGAAIAGVASVMLHYVPFIILEAVWTVVSLVAIINYFRKPVKA